MRAPLSWLREYAALPDDLDGRTLAEALIRAGLEVETVEQVGADVAGPLVIGKVVAYDVEVHSARCCPGASGSPRARPTGTSPTA
jgi:phenylalanyl-tRNA synthetase beta chain